MPGNQNQDFPSQLHTSFLHSFWQKEKDNQSSEDFSLENRKKAAIIGDTFQRYDEEGGIGGSELLGGAIAGDALLDTHHTNLPDALANDNELKYIEQSEIAESGAIFGVIAGFLWLILHDDSKITTKDINPWYRRFKTSASMGLDVGNALAYFIPFSYIHSSIAKIIQYILGDLLAIVFGLGGMLFGYVLEKIQFQKKSSPDSTDAIDSDSTDSTDSPESSDNNINNPAKSSASKNIFQRFALWFEEKSALYKFFRHDCPELCRFGEGGDGWTKYGKVGLVAGSAIGAAIGLFFGPLSSIAGAAIGGIMGFVIVIIGVPLINFFMAYNCSKNKETSFSVSETQKRYRTNYLRAGMSLFGAAGALIGAIIAGPIGAIVGAAVGTTLGLFIGGIAGPAISGLIKHEDNMQSSWDYSIRTGMMFGNQYGLGNLLTGICDIAGVKSFDVKDILVNSIGLVTGLVLGIGLTLYYQARNCFFADKRPREETIDQTLETLKNILPWSQTVATAIVISAGLGGFIGSFFPPFGMLIGMGIGGLVGGIIGWAYGDQINIKLVEIKQKEKDFREAFWKFINKIKNTFKPAPQVDNVIETPIEPALIDSVSSSEKPNEKADKTLAQTVDHKTDAWSKILDKLRRCVFSQKTSQPVPCQPVFKSSKSNLSGLMIIGGHRVKKQINIEKSQETLPVYENNIGQICRKVF